MPHPQTIRAVDAFLGALAAPVDVGIVRPAPEGERGGGFWRRRPLAPGEVVAMLPRVAAENTRGASIFVRIAEVEGQHPGVILLDDNSASMVDRMERDGFIASAIVETSPQNFQVWLRLCEPGKSLERALVSAAVKHLVARYGADPRALSPVQPGRLVGFTNRKEKHRQPDGRFPFVRLVRTAAHVVAPAAPELIASLRSELQEAQAGRARRAPKKQQFDFRSDTRGSSDERFDAFHSAQRERLLSEVASGRRPSAPASASEIDFAAAVAALEAGAAAAAVASWLTASRPDKAASYGTRTVEAAIDFIDGTRPSIALG